MSFQNRQLYLPVEYLMPGTFPPERFQLGDAEFRSVSQDGTWYASYQYGSMAMYDSADNLLVQYSGDGPDYIKCDTWHSLALVAPWQNFAGAQPLEYRKYPDGTVHVRGGLTSNGVAVAPGATIATLPAGYRPQLGVWQGTITSTTGAAGNLVIESGGAIKIWDFGAARAVFPLAVNVRFALD